jgi:class 3 adenylate cyclase
MTDIAGSTRLWEEQRAAMVIALAAHDALLRSAVEGAGGTVVKTTGDGLLAAFERPGAAALAALAGQRALMDYAWPTTTPLLVRMAIHAGDAETRDNDYFGPSLNRVARLLAIGHGGQVLVSSAGAALMADDLPAGATLLDRGEHRLRDLARPEHVYQLSSPGLATDFRPLRSGAAPTNLPADLTSFIGREREAAEIRELLRTHRLVTLVGVGGTGKTRLMLHAAGELSGRHPDGAWLIELAPLREPALVVQEVVRNCVAARRARHPRCRGWHLSGVTPSP